MSQLQASGSQDDGTFNRSGPRGPWVAMVACVAWATLVVSPSARAAIFVVNTTADTVDANPGDGICADSGGQCSLRAAISEANAWPGADTITLPAGTYLLTLAGASEDANATGDLDITSDITINGAGAASTIIDANQLDRVLQIAGGSTVTLTFFIPAFTIDCVRSVAVVVPSPVTSFVFEAASLTSCAPMFSNASCKSISLATETPSWTTFGAPHFLSRATFLPFGPKVMVTAWAS